MTYDPADLEVVIDHHQAEAEATGHPPLSVTAWRRACSIKLRQNEHNFPGHITRAAAGIRARTQGLRATGWREVRGTHGIDYIADPNGTDRPPWT